MARSFWMGIALLVAATAAAPAAAQSNVIAWGKNSYGQCNVRTPPPGKTYVEIAGGWGWAMGRLDNGRVLAWGLNSYGQVQVPQPPSGLDYVEIAAGESHGLGRLSDGSVVAWGASHYGTNNVPAPPPGETYVGISAGASHSIALVSDGSLVAWGSNMRGQLDVPALPPGVTYVDVWAGHSHNAALRSDGSLVAWGWNDDGQCDVPALPPGETWVEAACGRYHTAARRSDGAVAVWGLSMGTPPAFPPGESAVEVACGGVHVMVRFSDGTALAWGYNGPYGQCNVPALNTYLELAGGSSCSLARVEPVPVDSYCTSGLSSHGCQPRISCAGTPSATAPSGFHLRARDVEGARPGLFVFGTNGRQAKPWGNSTSYRCVIPPLKRATRVGYLAPLGHAGLCNGYFSDDLNALWYAVPAKNPGAGALVQAQLWYRDPKNTSVRKTGFSDAIEFPVGP
jgi:hypothetical protein